MRLLLIESSTDFCRVLENVLARGEFRVQSFPSPSQGWPAYQISPPDLILIELPADVAPVEDFLNKLRAHPAGSRVPVVLMSDVHHKDSKTVDRITRDHHVEEFLPRPFEMFGIARRLRSLGQSPRKINSPVRQGASAERSRKGLSRTRQKNPVSHSSSSNFRVLLEIWHQKKTGILRCTGDNNWVSIYSGGLSSDADIPRVKSLLQRPNLEFREIQQDGQGDTARIATLLWQEAESHVPVSFEIQLDKRFISLTERTHLGSELPLSEQTLRVLDKSSPQASTTALLADLDVPTNAVVRQLGALRALGLIRLEPIAAQRLGASRPTPSQPQLKRVPRKTANAGPLPQRPLPVPNGAIVLKRLKAEYTRLQQADPHTILGLPRDAGADMLHAATQRMESRYSMQSRDPELPKEARALAAKLARLVVEAETAILSADAQSEKTKAAASPPKSPAADPESIEELAFSEGTKAFAAGDYKRATQCFRKARDERIDSVRNLSWLGWAVFHHPNMAEQERIEESTDLLRLAVSFDPKHRQAQFFLAYIESKINEVESAIKRLQLLVKVHPDHREAKRLLHMLMSKAS